MEIYLVGGAVRDQLLSIPVTERDWVVVGSSPEEMLSLGYQPVGKEFPVFLHPETHEEYALARTERKVGKGYKGFTFYTDPSVTLEQDLLRRDLTVNAMAQDSNGRLIDPYHGIKDLQKKQFRHVSSAFAEDPVRILRVARFASKLPSFTVHHDTVKLMQSMVEVGEVDHLVPERVWQEFNRALKNPAPTRFFDVLDQCHALATLFPEVDLSGNAIQKIKHTDKTKLTAEIIFAILFYETDPAKLKKLNQRYRIPNNFADMAVLLNHHIHEFKQLNCTKPHDVLQLLLQLDGLRRPERFQDFLTAALICEDNHKAEHCLREGMQVIKHIDTTPLQKAEIKGKLFAEKLYDLRLEAITGYLTDC